MYQLNSGQANVQIDATNLATGQTTSVQTWATGGYQIALAPGTYQLTASQNDTVIQTTQVSIGSDNVEQDFLLNGTWDGRTRKQVLNALAHRATSPPHQRPSASTTPASPSSSIDVTARRRRLAPGPTPIQHSRALGRPGRPRLTGAGPLPSAPSLPFFDLRRPGQKLQYMHT